MLIIPFTAINKEKMLDKEKVLVKDKHFIIISESILKLFSHDNLPPEQ